MLQHIRVAYDPATPVIYPTDPHTSRYASFKHTGMRYGKIKVEKNQIKSKRRYTSYRLAIVDEAGENILMVRRPMSFGLACMFTKKVYDRRTILFLVRIMYPDEVKKYIKAVDKDPDEICFEIAEDPHTIDQERRRGFSLNLKVARRAYHASTPEIVGSRERMLQLPGGQPEHNESELQTAIREVEEELGLVEGLHYEVLDKDPVIVTYQCPEQTMKTRADLVYFARIIGEAKNGVWANAETPNFEEAIPHVVSALLKFFC